MAHEARMNSDADTTYNQVTETVTEKSAATKRGKKKWTLLFLGGTATLIGVLGSLHMRRQPAGTRAVLAILNDSTMEVSVVHPEKVPETISMELPGQTHAYTDAPIFAHTSGYLRAWYFDSGAKVKAGDVLAEIDTPEVDQ